MTTPEIPDEAVEAAQTAYHDYRVERGGNTTVEGVLRAALAAAAPHLVAAATATERERIATDLRKLADKWECTRDGVLSPGLRKAADDMQDAAQKIKADNDAVRRDSFQQYILEGTARIERDTP